MSRRARDCLLIVLASLVPRIPFALLPGYDVRDYRIWAALIAQDGATAIYHLVMPEVRIIPYNYPPIFAYLLDALDRLYLAISPSFDMSSWLLGLLLKALPILADTAIALSIYLFLCKRVSSRLALAGAFAYALNPAIIWNSAYWGGIDAIHALLALLSVALLIRRLPEASWALMTLSILTKPLALPVAAVVAFLSILRFDLKRIALSFAAVTLTVLAVVSPFLAAGTFAEMWSALTMNVGNYNNISVNAHNFWWLVSGGYGWTNDAQLIAGTISYRFAGLVLFALFAVWCLYLLQRRSEDKHVFGVAALLSFAFYMLPTEVHENWLFGAFPFLVIACVLEPRLRPVLIGLTLTFWLNMALHDLYFGYQLPAGWLGSLLAFARTANSVANSALFFFSARTLMRIYSGEFKSTKNTKSHQEIL